MLRDSDFSFAYSLLAVGPPPHPEQDPIRHTLPPEPPSLKSSGIKHSLPSGEYVNITLGNSPEYSNNLHVPKPVYTISKFNKQVEETSKKAATEGQRDSKGTSAIKSNMKPIGFKKTEYNYLPKETQFEKKANNTVAERGNSKETKVINSSLQNQSTVRNPRQDTILPQAKRKFTGRHTQSSQSPDKLALVNKIEELKTRLAQGENISKALGMQLQLTREKLKIREAEQIEIYQRLEGYAREVEARKQAERDLLEQRRMNDYFCEEIDKQKAEVVRYEQKNEESLRLLQQLNENITKREEKLQKDLSEQTANYNRLIGEKSETQEKLKIALEKIAYLERKVDNLQQQKAERESLAQRFHQEASGVQQEKQLWKSQLTETETNFKIIKEEANSLRALLNEANQQKQRLLIEVGKLQKENSSLKERVDFLTKSEISTSEQYNKQIETINFHHEEILKDLKAKLANCEGQLEELYYSGKESETRLEVANATINESLAEIKDLKEEKKVLQLEKEELKGDLKQLLNKNDQLYIAIETAKKKELELNKNISELQKQIIVLQQRITENIATIADKDMEASSLYAQIAQHRASIEDLLRQLESKDYKIADIQEKQRKYEKMLGIYKEQLGRMKDNKETQWQEMRGVYEQQIMLLEEKLKQLLQSKEKRSKSGLKLRKQIKEQAPVNPKGQISKPTEKQLSKEYISETKVKTS